MKEYAIFDNNGVQFGLPARSWRTVEELDRAFDVLVARRSEMQQEAVEARQQIEAGDAPVPVQQRMQDAVQRWELEKQRSYVKRMREVGPWNPLG